MPPIETLNLFEPMAKQSKITVKHYPNTNLKPQTENGKLKYPLYVQVIYNSTNYKFKSENEYFKYVYDKDLENDFICKMLDSEKKRIERTVLLISQNNEKLLTSKDIYKYSKPLDKIIEKNFGKLIEKEFIDAPPQLTNLSYLEISKLVHFFNNSDKLEQSNKIKNVCRMLSELGYMDPNFYNDVGIWKIYSYVDLYFGNDFLDIIKVFDRTALKDNVDSKIYLENFRYFIDL